MLVLAALLFACADGAADCTTDLAPGAAQGRIDDLVLDATDAAWREAGASLQVNAAGAATLSMVLQTTTDGTPIAEAVAPFSVDLGPDGGGWIVVYPDAGASLTTQEGLGTLEVSGVPAEGGLLSGCATGTVSDGEGDDRDLELAIVAAEAAG